LKLHQAIEGAKLGGVGPGLSPGAALRLGLKVDADALPHSIIAQIKAGKVDLNDPGLTVALIKLNSVLGVTGRFDESGKLKSIGIQCALCHSTVDNSVAQGIGHRLDGWANRDLDVGSIIAFAPNLEPIAQLLSTDQATVRTVLHGRSISIPGSPRSTRTGRRCEVSVEHDACIVHEHIELGKSDFHTRRERSDLRRMCDIALDSVELRCLLFTSSSTDSRRPVTLPREQV